MLMEMREMTVTVSSDIPWAGGLNEKGARELNIVLIILLADRGEGGFQCDLSCLCDFSAMMDCIDKWDTLVRYFVATTGQIAKTETIEIKWSNKGKTLR